ncbi:MAG: 3'(2'),5'-bisphosphate nucleotidase CysQ [Flavobacteriales bacterium]|nr:3'(2'),5'-bisphosphate nucleotidase CysQ [Flavobacteriales bacterium]
MRNEEIVTAVQAALEAGRAILKVYDTAFTVDVKEDLSPLTEADRQAHHAIVKRLKPLGLPILSEEGRNIPFAERKNWEQFWLVDPLDGTKEFVKRNGEFTVNIALVEKGDPIVGIIYVPVKDVLYVGVHGMGAVKIDESSMKELSGLNALFQAGTMLHSDPERTVFTVVGSRSHMSDETLAYVDLMRQQHGEVEMVSMGSSLKLCLVAEGVADVYPRFAPTMEWDTAAGQGIAMAAGCTVSEQDGITPLRYNKENLLNPWFIVKR